MNVLKELGKCILHHQYKLFIQLCKLLKNIGLKEKLKKIRDIWVLWMLFIKVKMN